MILAWFLMACLAINYNNKNPGHKHAWPDASLTWGSVLAVLDINTLYLNPLLVLDSAINLYWALLYIFLSLLDN